MQATTDETLDGTGVEPDDDTWDGEDDGSTESIEDRADNGEPVGPPPILGREVQLSLLAGGEEPDSSTFKLRGGSLPVEGEFEKGSIVILRVVASVDEVTFADKKDNDGYVVSTERRHVAKIMSVRRLEEE
jgi:hypothetical protein